MPGYTNPPATSNKSEAKRKWYFRHSMVVVPYDHALYQTEDGIVTAKRYGRLIRSQEKHAIQVLTKELDNIKQFVAERVLEAE